jgi:hypothetical protein
MNINDKADFYFMVQVLDTILGYVVQIHQAVRTSMHEPCIQTDGPHGLQIQWVIS